MLTGSQRTKNFCKFGYYSNLSESSLGLASGVWLRYFCLKVTFNPVFSSAADSEI